MSWECAEVPKQLLKATVYPATHKLGVITHKHIQHTHTHTHTVYWTNAFPSNIPGCGCDLYFLNEMSKQVHGYVVRLLHACNTNAMLETLVHIRNMGNKFNCNVNAMRCVQ